MTVENPTIITLDVHDKVDKVYVTVWTNAYYKQRVHITPLGPADQPLAESEWDANISEGSGIHNVIKNWEYPISKKGLYKFKVHIENNPGSGWRDSTILGHQLLEAFTMREVVVFSEDWTDNDFNDSLIRFTWYLPGHTLEDAIPVL